MPHVKVFAVINQKGGVGKTTTVANLGAAVAARGHDVCLIDLDPQAHLTLHFGIEPGSTDTSIYDVLINEEPITSARQKVTENLSVVPSVIDLAAAEVELVTTVGREQILADRLAADDLNHEFVIIDCPPSLGLLTLNALAAADAVLIPLQPHFLALQGLGKLLETVSLVQRRINPRLKVAGVIFCMYETQTRLAGEVVADLEEFLNSMRDQDTPWSQTKIFPTRIRRNIKLAECPSYGSCIFDYDPKSRGASDYLSLAEDFLAIAGAPSTDRTESKTQAATQKTEVPFESAQPDSEPQSAQDNTPAEPAAQVENTPADSPDAPAARQYVASEPAPTTQSTGDDDTPPPTAEQAPASQS